MTKIRALPSLSLLCFVVSIQCYGGRENNPLAKDIKAQKAKRSSSIQDEVLKVEHLPVYIGPQDGLREADK